MRISDWSSDVCSSDLPVDHVADLCLGRSGEIFLGIGAAHRIAEIGIERRQCPLVAAALLWRTGQARAVKGEMRGVDRAGQYVRMAVRSAEHKSELQSLMRISYAVFCLKKKKKHNKI